jgi:hypothetical protein
VNAPSLEDGWGKATGREETAGNSNLMILFMDGSLFLGVGVDRQLV